MSYFGLPSLWCYVKRLPDDSTSLWGVVVIGFISLSRVHKTSQWHILRHRHWRYREEVRASCCFYAFYGCSILKSWPDAVTAVSRVSCIDHQIPTNLMRWYQPKHESEYFYPNSLWRLAVIARNMFYHSASNSDWIWPGTIQVSRSRWMPSFIHPILTHHDPSRIMAYFYLI